MFRSTLISVALCSAATAALFVWMFSNDPMPPRPKVVAAAPIGKMVATKQPGKVVFSGSRNQATALNNEPVNIVINPNSASSLVQTGPADLVVRVSGLRMRAEPTSRSELIGSYSKGAKFAHIRDENGWSLVQSLEDGQKGWMFKKYMDKEG